MTTLTNEQIDMVLCTAFESGIGYWCARIEHDDNFPDGANYGHEVVSRGQPITLVLHNPEDSDTPLVIDKAKIVEGINQAAQHQGMTPQVWYEQHDADGADLAVQYAAFGEVVYG